MKFYLDSILKGFKPVNSEVVLEGIARQTPNFVIVDIDQDGMPEILFTYQMNGEKYIGILKRRDMQWYLYDVSLEKNQKALGLGNLVNVLNNVNLTEQDIGKTVTMQDLVGSNNQAFVSYVNDILNHGMVMQQIAGEETVGQANEPVIQYTLQSPLPPGTPLVSAGIFTPANVLNTQAAPNQNVTTPMMGVNEAGLNMNNMQGAMTGEQIIQQTGTLPSPENINTPQAQAALNQNVTTPIMGVNEAGLNANNMQGAMTGGQIIQQTGALPPPQNINTLQAQAALNQNATTPIMGVNEVGLNTNNMQGAMTGEQIIQQTGTLPPPENINTPQAQAALNQNVTTPIMSVSEEGLNTNNMQGTMTGGQIIQQTGALPPPQNINTSQAQAALNQNFITPIMSANGVNQMTDETAFEEEQDASEIPEIKVYNIGNNMGTFGTNVASDKEVIKFAQADVTGDGVLDNIFLVGNRPRPEVPNYIEDAGLRVVANGRVYEIDFPYGNGYSPVLFVGDLTHDGIADILVNIFAGGDGGFLTSYAYTFANEQPRLLADSKTFNDLQTGTVMYQDNYRVRIETVRPPRAYTIDISDRGPDYLNEIYNPDGTLIRPVEGTLLGLASLHPVDFDVSGEYNLSAIQRAIGLSNLDTLGLLETYFTWRPAINRFQPFAQYFSVLGQPLR